MRFNYIGDNHKINVEKMKNIDHYIMVDCGASFGETILDFVKIRKDNYKVYAVEPGKNNLKILKEKVKDLNVEIIEKGISKKSDEEYDFVEYVGKNGKYHKWNNAKGKYGDQLLTRKNNGENIQINKYKINTISINDIIKKYKINKIDYLKIDTEGFEVETLMGISNDNWEKIYEIGLEYHSEEDKNKIKEILNSKDYIYYEDDQEQEIYAVKITPYDCNFQPYDLKNEDTTGWRKIDFFKKNIYPKLIVEFKGLKTIKDVGCGNGRIVPFIATHFDRIVATDIRDMFNPNFLNNKVEFKKENFMESKEKFDCLLFYGSFDILFKYCGVKFIKKIKENLNENGKVIVMIESDSFNEYKTIIEKDLKIEKIINDTNMTKTTILVMKGI